MIMNKKGGILITAVIAVVAAVAVFLIMGNLGITNITGEVINTNTGEQTITVTTSKPATSFRLGAERYYVKLLSADGNLTSATLRLTNLDTNELENVTIENRGSSVILGKMNTRIVMSKSLTGVIRANLYFSYVPVSYEGVLEMLNKCVIYSVAEPEPVRMVTGDDICNERNAGTCIFTGFYSEINNAISVALNGNSSRSISAVGSGLGIIDRCTPYKKGPSTETVAYCCKP